MAMSLTVMLYLVMYILLFTAFIYLNLTNKTKQASFKIPGGRLACLLIGIIGLIGSMIVFSSTFLPTTSTTLATGTYALVMGGFLIVVLAVTLVIYSRRRTKPTKRNWHIRHLRLEEVPRFAPIQGRGEHTIEIDVEPNVKDSSANH